nr:AAA family ATPase [Spirochaetota bacterium]
MGKIVTIANQKGGVGKTTTAINLSCGVALQGKKVLVVDFDPQGNCSSGLGVKKDENTVYEALMEKIPVEKAIVKTDIENCFVIPANINLTGAGVELVDKDEREFFLKKLLLKVKNDYDFIFIDCPPSLGILTLNGLVACDTVLIPLQTEFFALEGLSQLVNTINLVKRNLNPNLRIEGVLLT